MSAIFGIWYHEGRPVPAAMREAIQTAMTPWGPDGLHVETRGSVLLGFARLCTTPEGRYECLLRKDAAGVLLTAAARLDNRDELCDRFAVPPPERPSVPDGRLVFLAWERFGDEAPRHLYGDWAFAAWDERKRRLFLARDHLGCTGIFHCRTPSFFAFASTPKALIALPEFPVRLDERHLARYLVISLGDEKQWTETFWQDVRLLLPAHSLTVTPEETIPRKYWSLDEAAPLAFRRDEDYLEGFLDRFRRSIRARLRSVGPVGSQSSAGLDSSSVTALAAEALREVGQGLSAFTSVPLHSADRLVPGALADEWPLAHAIAECHPNIEHVAVRAEGASPLRVVCDGLALCGCPLHAAANLYWIQAIHREAQRRGVRVMLTGQLGNGGVSWSGGSQWIYRLFVQGRVTEGLRALQGWRNRHDQSWYRTIRRHFLSPLLGPAWRKGKRLFHSREPLWVDYSAIHPEFARRMGLLDAAETPGEGSSAGLRNTPAWQRRRTIDLNAPLGYIHHHLGAATGMDVRDPTADVRLLLFCFGIPDRLFTGGGGERMVIRRAMQGILPDRVRRNPTRGRQAADVGLRLLDHREEMEDTIRALEASETAAAYLDCGALRKAWRDLQRRVTPTRNGRAAALLLRGIMAGRFIAGITPR